MVEFSIDMSKGHLYKNLFLLHNHIENMPHLQVINVTFTIFPVHQNFVLELLHTHLGFLFPKVFPCLLVIISHYPVSYNLGENILFQLTLQFD